MFKKRENVAAIEEGKLLSPKFDKDGLIPVVTTGIRPSPSNFGDNNLPSSIVATFSLFLNICLNYKKNSRIAICNTNIYYIKGSNYEDC